MTVVTGVPNVSNGVPYDGYRNRLWQDEEVQGIRVIRVWTYLAPNKGTIRRTLNYLSFMVSAFIAGLFVTRPDIVVATSPQFFCGWAGSLVCKLRGIPFVLEIRDLWPESIKAVGAVRNRIVLGFLSWLEGKAYSNADHIVTVGDGYRKKLLERKVPAEKITVISNGVDRDFFIPREPQGSLRKQYSPKGSFLCSYIGTVGMAAGLEVVLRAAKKLQVQEDTDIRFLIVGDGAALAALRKSAKQQRLDNVIFAGRQIKERIPEYLALSDACFVHLKKQELFSTVMPSKIFESLAMERPIILGVRGFAEEFIRTSGGGICVEPEDEDALIRAIDELRANPALAKRLGEQGREYVLKHYDGDRLADKYIKLLQRVLHPKATGGNAPAGPTIDHSCSTVF